MLMGLSTFAIGLLPNYAQIGVWAPVLLIALPVRPGVCARRRVGRRGADVGGARAAGTTRVVRQLRRAGAAGRASSCRTSSSSSRRSPSRRTSSPPGPGGSRSSPAPCSSWSDCSCACGIAESPIFAEAQKARPRDGCRWSTSCAATGDRAARGRQLPRHQRARLHRDRVLRHVCHPGARPAAGRRRLPCCSRARRCIAALDRGVRDLVGPASGGAGSCAGDGRARLWSLDLLSAASTRGRCRSSCSRCAGCWCCRAPTSGRSRRSFPSCFRPHVRYSGASLSLTLGTILGGAPAPFIATALFGAGGKLVAGDRLCRRPSRSSRGCACSG